MPRTVSLGILERVYIASPCPMKWEDMVRAGQGDDRVRYCGECRLNVYNLSSMTLPEAESLILAHEGRLCAGFHRRADGTILTRDCPVGLRAVRLRAAKAWARIAAAVTLMITGSLALGEKRGWWSPRVRQMQPFSTIVEFLRPAPPAPLPAGGLAIRGQTFILGKVAATPLPPAPAPAPACEETAP